jgi:catechol 2,3-dioxygenase-like lactoylglutathione lyase family enzyme
MHSRIHVSLEVSNLEESIAFYSRLFQSEPTKVRTDYSNFRLDKPGIHLALVLTPNRTPEPMVGPGSNRHFGVELFSDETLQSWLTASKSAGLPIRVEDDVTCCYARANKFWARDPDGHNWEFWVRTAEADSMHGAESENFQATESQCCAPSPAQKGVQVNAPSCCPPNQCG